MRTVSAFVETALRENRRCLYLADDNAPAEIRSALRAAGIDVDARENADDLEVREAAEVYLDDGFDGERTVRVLERAAVDAIEGDYEGLTVAGENTWCFHDEMAFDEVIEFETEFDARASDLPITALCQYDVGRFDERSLAEALRVHERIVYRGIVCENPHFVPPTKYADRSGPETNARMMLEQTHDLARSSRDIERREQRLAVVNRILRHNVRNDLNAVLGNLSLLRNAASLDGPARDHLDTARRVAERIVETAEKARYVQPTATDPTLETADVDGVVAEAVERTLDNHPDAEIEVTGATDATVLVDDHIDVALEEALTNAVVHQDDTPPSVALDASRGDNYVTITISNPGPRIPEADRNVFRRGEETRLIHGSGLGLWLVKWVVENAHGRVRLPDEGSDRSGDGQNRLDLDLVAVSADSPGSPGGDRP